MSLEELLRDGAPPIIAILRGVRPAEVLDIAGALIDAGIRIIETPLNSPEPLASIEQVAVRLGERACIGAGTATSAASVDAVADAGGRLIVAPNTDQAVITRALARGLEVLPGVMTATEAFTAIAAGARHLKLFPAGSLGPGHLRALKEVLPEDRALWAVGGVSAGNLAQWLEAGATGVGVGGSLYRPGDSPDVVGARATKLVAAWQTLRPSPQSPKP